jgi:hypothetical protein
VYLITGFGITSSFWDKIFGTEIILRKLSRALKWWQWNSSLKQGSVQKSGYQMQSHKRTILYTNNIQINVICAAEVTERHTMDQPLLQHPQLWCCLSSCPVNSVHMNNGSDNNVTPVQTVGWLSERTGGKIWAYYQPHHICLCSVALEDTKIV